MLNSTTLQLFYDHQGRATAVINRAATTIETSRPVDAAEISRARWGMMRLLTEYQMFKHREIFDPAIRRGDIDEMRAAREMKAQCIAMGEEFRTYVAKWSSLSVADRWAEYRPATIAIVARLREHLTQERRQVEAILRVAPAVVPLDRAAIR